MIKGQIIGGEIDSIEIREKNNANVQLGELLVCEISKDEKIILQVYNLTYGSLIEKAEIEATSGFMLEGMYESEIMEREIRLFKKIIAKPILKVKKVGNKIKVRGVKTLPPILSYVRGLKEGDLDFLAEEGNLMIGHIRSGTEVLEIPVYLDAKKIFSHHILIAGSTGKGKSVLMKNLIWEAAKQEGISLLVFDPHNEYYVSSKTKKGLSDFPNKEKVIYFTQNTKNIVNANLLKVPLAKIRPSDLDIFEFSEAQRQAMIILYRKYNKEYEGGWIAYLVEKDSEEIAKENASEGLRPESLDVLRRKIIVHLALEVSEERKLLDENNIFVKNSSYDAISQLVREIVSNDKVVIVDTSRTTGDVELVLANMIAKKVFERKKKEIENRRTIAIVLEEAPRVIGKRILAKGPNIFGTIAREGRKFGVGFVGITQIPSEIPKEILSNMNTKIILGLESASERNAIIDSASQDLSKDAKAIASLDIGEAIVTSVFTKFAIPIKVPNFNEKVEEEISKENKMDRKKAYFGL